MSQTTHFRLLCLTLILVGIAGTSSAQIDGGTIEGTPDPLQIALPAPTLRADFPNAKEISTWTLRMLSDDLRMSRSVWGPNFRVEAKGVSIQAQAKRDSQTGATDFEAWRQLKQEYVLRLIISGTGDDVTFEMWIDDIKSARRLQGIRVGPVAQRGFRAAVHSLSDWVVNELLKTKGIAQSKIAFVSKSGSTKEIYVIDYDGHSSTLVPITNFNSISLSPTWAPNARDLAYVSFRKGWADIYVHNIYNPSGTRYEELATFKGNNITPSWNPINPNQLAVSLSFTGNPDIYLIGRDKRVSPALTTSPGIDVSPTVSPDGTQIAFTSDRVGRQPQIYIMDINGQNQRQISQIPGTSCDLPVWSPVKIKGSYRIAFYGYKNRQGQIYTMKPDGSELQQITNGPGNHASPSWSPDGMYLAYSADEAGLSQIYICCFDGTPPPGQRSHLRIDPIPGAEALSPAWSPIPE